MRIRNYFIRSGNPFYPIMTSLVTFFWGLWAIIFNSLNSSTSFGVALSVMPSWEWGALAIVLAIGQLLYAFGRSGFIIFSMLLFIFWAFLAICIGLGDYTAPGIVLYSWMAIFIGFGWVSRRAQED